MVRCFVLDITGWPNDEVMALINMRIVKYESVQIYKEEDKKMMRTWTVSNSCKTDCEDE